MKINVTLSIDEKVKNKAMKIAQNDLNSSLSKEVEKFLKELCKKHGKK